MAKEVKKITAEQIAKLEKLGVDFEMLKIYYQIDDIKDLSYEKAEQAIMQKSKGKK